MANCQVVYNRRRLELLLGVIEPILPKDWSVDDIGFLGEDFSETRIGDQGFFIYKYKTPKLLVSADSDTSNTSDETTSLIYIPNFLSHISIRNKDENKKDFLIAWYLKNGNFVPPMYVSEHFSYLTTYQYKDIIDNIKETISRTLSPASIHFIKDLADEQNKENFNG